VDVSENRDNMKDDKKTPLLTLSKLVSPGFLHNKMLNTHTGEERRGVTLELRL
jgi:hypothetical protein